MARAVKALDQDFSKLNTGRPSASILDNVKVDYYGVPTPVSQVGAIKIPEGNLMTIEPWDKSLLGPVEKAILSANLGITPNNDGSGIIRLPFPAPTEERRREIVKECKAAAENRRVAVRNAPPRCQEQDRASQEGRRDQRGRAASRRRAASEAHR